MSRLAPRSLAGPLYDAMCESDVCSQVIELSQPRPKDVRMSFSHESMLFYAAVAI